MIDTSSENYHRTCVKCGLTAHISWAFRYGKEKICLSCRRPEFEKVKRKRNGDKAFKWRTFYFWKKPKDVRDYTGFEK